METLHENVGLDAPAGESSPDVLTLSYDQRALAAKRIVAFLIDLVVAALLWQIPLAGKPLGLVYILLRDGLDLEFMKGRSIGKKLMRLKAVRSNGLPMDLHMSIRRNWVFVIAGIGGFFGAIPLIGWLIVLVAVSAGIAVALMEIYRTMTHPEGRRWGDVLAGTRVVAEDD